MEKLTAEFVRKPFTIEAVRVTSDNMELVAKWCGGEIRNRERSKTRFIQVEVTNALNERQTMAYVGDWVMFAGKGYKVYNNMAFEMAFDSKAETETFQIMPGTTELIVDLDRIQPKLVMIKGNQSYSFDIASFFAEKISA